jgi:hypothetical protein
LPQNNMRRCYCAPALRSSWRRRELQRHAL